MALEKEEIVEKIKHLASKSGKTPTVKELEASGVSKRKILLYGHNNLVRLAGLKPNYDERKPVEIKIKKPKVLIIDIEVAPILAYTYALYDLSIPKEYVVRDFYILSFSAKFLDEKKIYYHDLRHSKNPSNDKKLVQKIYNLINRSDYICGHNLDRFDLKKIKTRGLHYGLKPPSNPQQIDTLKIAKKHFSVTSNSLDYLAKFLKCKNTKYPHSKFSGNKLWLEVMAGNKKAYSELEKYNKQDVLVTEEVLKKLMPYEKSISFMAFYNKAVCTCGGVKFVKDGFKYTATSKKQVWRCVSCGKSFIDRSNLLRSQDRDTWFYKQV